METIEVNGLELWARHGVGEQERKVGNLFRIDVCLDVDLTDAMMSDNVADTISYADVIALIKREMEQPSALLENVVWRIRESVAAAYPCVRGGMVRVAKVTPPIACRVDSVAVATRW